MISIAISVIFLAVFLLNMVIGAGIGNVWDLISGAALAIAVMNLAPKLLKYIEKN